MKSVSTIGLMVLLAGGSACLAQDAARPASDWVGEWGSYTLVPSSGQMYRQYLGDRIAVSDCKDSRCKLEMNIRTAAGNCDTTEQGTLHIQSSTNATASLGGDKCTIVLQRSGGEKNAQIESDKGTAGCSYFCTSGADFKGTFVQRSHAQFFGEDIESCYVAASRAQMAVCESHALADQEHEWKMLSLEVAELEEKTAASDAETARFLAKCDAPANTSACLGSAFSEAIEELNLIKKTWIEQATEAGSPEDASRKMALIAGRYRHAFSNGDVQGHDYKSVDRMRITGISRSAIHYSLELNFYNGHSCRREGTATYKANGAFVDQVKDVSSGTCYFELVPIATGVSLRDPNGACKIQSCGERGGYSGADFLFTQKIHARK